MRMPASYLMAKNPLLPSAATRSITLAFRPWMIAAMVITARTPMVTPSTVRKERNLWR